MNLNTLCSPIKRGISPMSLASATSTSWSFTTSTAICCGQRASRTTLAESLYSNAQGLECMQKVGMIPKHQSSIKGLQNSHWQLEHDLPTCSPKEHQRNMAQKTIQMFNDHFIGILSPCISGAGANSSLKWSINFFSSNNPNFIQTCPPTHTSMAITTTTKIYVYQLGWKHW